MVYFSLKKYILIFNQKNIPSLLKFTAELIKSKIKNINF